MATLGEIIASESALPLKSGGDGQSAEGQPLPDLIAADKHLAAKTTLAVTNANGGSRSGWAGLRPARVIPPGGA